MPSIHRLSNATIYIYPDDEAPPHFHIRGPNSNVKVEIATLRVMRGEYRRSDLVEAIAWANDNQALLRAKWKEFNERD
ncbi:MAG: DUF4160 domain-containing protein [Xanthobacteraceae bacterium]